VGSELAPVSVDVGSDESDELFKASELESLSDESCVGIGALSVDVCVGRD